MSISGSAISSTAISGAAAASGGCSVDIQLLVQSQVNTTELAIVVFVQHRVTIPVNLEIQSQYIAQNTAVDLEVLVQTVVPAPIDLLIDIQHQIFSPLAVGPNPSVNTLYWDFSILLGGVDVTTRVLGVISVEREEDAATIGEFEMLPFAGVVQIYDWVDQSVIIDFKELSSTGDVQGVYRLFTGLVNVPVYNPSTGTVVFNCTDDLQGTIERTNKEDISGILPMAKWSPDIFQEVSDNWKYFTQLISTIPYSYELDFFGVGQLTPWNAPTIDYTYTDDDVLYNSSDIDIVFRRGIINKVEISLDHTTSNNWKKRITGNWVYPRVFEAWLLDPTTLPTKDLITSAVSADGWSIDVINFSGLPPTGLYNFPDVHGFVLTDAAKEFVLSCSFAVSKRWKQTHVETYNISVVCPESISMHGELVVSDSYAMADDVEDTWEDPGISSGDIPAIAPVALGSGFSVDRKFPDLSSIAAVDTATETAISIAYTEILSSHRANSLQFELVLQPLMSLTKRVRVDTDRIVGEGKVSKIRHELGVASGSATSKITTSVYQPSAPAQVETPIAPAPSSYIPPAPVSMGLTSGLQTRIGNEILSPGVDDPTWLGYVGNNEKTVLVGAAEVLAGTNIYKERFTVEYSGVNDSNRNKSTTSSPSTYNVAIPQDILTISGS